MDYEDIIIKNLKDLGYEERQIEAITPKILASAKFLSRDKTTPLSEDFFDFRSKTTHTATLLEVPQETILQSALYDPFILIRSGERLEQNALEAAEALQIPKRTYVEKLLPYHPNILGHTRDNIMSNVHSSATAIDMSWQDYRELCLRQPVLFGRSGERVTETVEEGAKALGITPKQYTKAAKKDPSLLYKDPVTTRTNVEYHAYLTGLPFNDYVALVIKQGQEQLFTRAPETFLNNITEAPGLLGIEEDEYIKAARRRLTILAYEPQRLRDKVDEMSQRLGTTYEASLKACSERPELFTLDMARIEKNVETLAEYLNTSKEILGPILVAQGPTALFQNPDTIKKRLDKVTELTGLDRDEYASWALKKVNLLWRDPEAVAHNWGLLRQFNAKGILARDVKEFIATKPDILAVAPNNLHLRYLYARAAGLSELPAFTLLRDTRSKIEKAFMATFDHDPAEKTITRPALYGDHLPREEKRHTAMIGLIKRGIFSGYTYKPEI